MGYTLTFDYTELLDELQSDIKEFGYTEDDIILVVREWTKVTEHMRVKSQYNAIIDYYLRDSDNLQDDVERMTVRDVLTEMHVFNSMS